LLLLLLLSECNIILIDQYRSKFLLLLLSKSADSIEIRAMLGHHFFFTYSFHFAINSWRIQSNQKTQNQKVPCNEKKNWFKKHIFLGCSSKEKKFFFFYLFFYFILVAYIFCWVFCLQLQMNEVKKKKIRDY